MASRIDSPQQPRRSADPQRATIGWWGITSLASGLLATSFIPAAMMSGGGWANLLNQLWPIWAVCCIFGMASGIHGLQKQRKATPLQRRLAFAGTLLSMFVFIVLALIALIALD